MFIELSSRYLWFPDVKVIRHTSFVEKKMIEIRDRLFVGNETDCRLDGDEWAIIHACKIPCHQRAVCYRGSLSQSHPNYLILEKENDLYMNIIDPPRPLFRPLLFTSFLEFSGRHWNNGKKLLIHCNKGESRAPSLALLFMAKHLHEIDNSSYAEARQEFEQIFHGYQPGFGIQIYFRDNWNNF